MARTKKVDVVLRSTRDESAWIAEAKDGSGVAAQHYLPSTAILVLGERLREHHGGDVELSYEFELPPALREDVEELLDVERRLQELTHVLPAKRLEVAQKLAQRHLKQQDIANIMHLSQGYLASIIKRGAMDKQVKIKARRRTTST